MLIYQKTILLPTILSVLVLTAFSPFEGRALAEVYTAETLAEAAPADNVAPEIAKLLSEQGIRVVKDGKRTVCEIWPLREMATLDGVETSDERLYPFEVGQLLGVVRLRRRGSDFRDQDISRGVYTMRYALQPVDGNHVGTSPTRDFLLLVKAADDPSSQPMKIGPLNEASAEAAGSTHPAMWCLQRLKDKAPSSTVRKTEGKDWWVLRMESQAKGGDQPLPIDLIVVGHAEE